jgi:hypothetical protein
MKKLMFFLLLNLGCCYNAESDETILIDNPTATTTIECPDKQLLGTWYYEKYDIYDGASSTTTIKLIFNFPNTGRYEYYHAYSTTRLPDLERINRKFDFIWHINKFETKENVLFMIGENDIVEKYGTPYYFMKDMLYLYKMMGNTSFLFKKISENK